MDKLKDYLLSGSKDNLLPWSVQQDASRELDITYAEVDETALQMNLLPVRYKRNRQTISTEQQLGLFRSRVAVIGCGELLKGVNVAVDALDSIDARLELAGLCRELEIPLVHGSIAGWYGQVATQFPGDDTIEKIFNRCRKGTGVESELGNVSFTPAVVASIETAEVCKILLKQSGILRHCMLSVNLLDMEIVKVPLPA